MISHEDAHADWERCNSERLSVADDYMIELAKPPAARNRYRMQHLKRKWLQLWADLDEKKRIADLAHDRKR